MRIHRTIVWTTQGGRLHHAHTPIAAVPCDPKSRCYRPVQICSHHSGMRGHPTKECSALKNMIQKLIDTKMINVMGTTFEADWFLKIDWHLLTLVKKIILILRSKLPNIRNSFKFHNFQFLLCFLPYVIWTTIDLIPLWIRRSSFNEFGLTIIKVSFPLLYYFPVRSWMNWQYDVNQQIWCSTKVDLVPSLYFHLLYNCNCKFDITLHHCLVSCVRSSNLYALANY